MLLSAEHLSINFGSRQLLEDVNFYLNEGDKIGVIGINGTGKSTFLKVLAGRLEADAGTISRNPNVQVSLLEQNPPMEDDATVLEQVFLHFPKEFRELNEYEAKSMLNRLGLPDYEQKVGTLSGGQRKRVALAAALIHPADVLILDEPTVGLDVIARDEVLNMLREYMEENESSSILISSHISSDLESLCDDFYMIHAGKIILHEDTDVLLSDYAVLKVSEEEYEKLDQQYLIKIRKEAYGYRCLTNQKQFYMENYPDVVIENGKIDDLVVMMEEQV